MAELKEYQKWMEYDESKMKSMKYKMKVYDEFLKEHKYWKSIASEEEYPKKWKDRDNGS